MIRIGPAGIPLSCKGRTLKDGIIYTKSLELDSLEVQFVRGIRMTVEEAREVREVAEAADVELHVHAPYYTNLAGDERNLKLTREKVLKAGEMAHEMGAHTVVVHPGFYGEYTPQEAQERIVQVVGDLRDEYKENQWHPRLGLVTMGKRAVFGSLDEIIDVCKQVPEVQPVVDFAHIHARGNGSLNTVEDFQEVFDQLIPLSLDHTLIHFTGVRYENGNERHHLPIKKGDLRLEPLVEVVLENDYNVTLISTSPILEHDAMYMQIVLDRVKEKREQRVKKEVERKKREEEEAAIAAAAEAESKAEYEKETTRQAEQEPEPGPEPGEPEAGKKGKKAAPKPKQEPRPRCAAITQSGAPCSNPARTGSKYCSSHKGYRPARAAKKRTGGKVPADKPKSGGSKSGGGSDRPGKTGGGRGKSASKTARATKKAPRKGATKTHAKKSGSSRSKGETGNKKKPETKKSGGPGKAGKSEKAGRDGAKPAGRFRKAARRLVRRKEE